MSDEMKEEDKKKRLNKKKPSDVRMRHNNVN